LLLGRGGIRNDAPNLTDSIILASINKKYKTISMFSIPRDLYVEYYN
jgi:anionic cell wall polymer biosynthesis LytR-Cps2A-Psr (LCP) family protein